MTTHLGLLYQLQAEQSRNDLKIKLTQNMINYLHSDIQTFQRLHAAIPERNGSWPTVMALVGSSRPQPATVQKIIDCYLQKLEPYAGTATFLVGGRGEYGSAMDASVEGCYKRNYRMVIVGIEPIFDLGGRVPAENVFSFNNVSLRCYALTQLSDLLIVFPGGLGTIQEIIVPLMHKKLDTSLPDTLQGPRAIFVAMDEPNPVTEFLPIIKNKSYISMEGSIALYPVTVTSFSTVFRQWRASQDW